MSWFLSLFRPRARPTRARPTGNPTRVFNIDPIKKHEGLRLKAYLPTPNDVWTIGYGHTASAREGQRITREEAVRLLRRDISWVEDALNDAVEVSVSQEQYDALASLVFNIGASAFRRSTVLRRLNASDYAGAADAFLMWNKQRNRKTGKLEPLRGLTRRRSEERALFLEGTKR